MLTTLHKLGNSWGVIIPKPVLAQVGMPGQVEMKVENGAIVLRPVGQAPRPELDEYLRTVVAAPMTSGSRPAPFRIPIGLQRKSGLILLDQLRTLDRQRLIKKLGMANCAANGPRNTSCTNSSRFSTRPDLSGHAHDCARLRSETLRRPARPATNISPALHSAQVWGSGVELEAQVACERTEVCMALLVVEPCQAQGAVDDDRVEVVDRQPVHLLGLRGAVRGRVEGLNGRRRQRAQRQTQESSGSKVCVVHAYPCVRNVVGLALP